MPETSTAPDSAAKAQRQSLVCRVRTKVAPGFSGPAASMGEVELENCSHDPLEIEYTMTPLQFFELEVVGPGGGVVSEGHFSDRFSPTRDPAVLRLLPGEKFTSCLSLLATVPRNNRVAGKYTIRAAYLFRDETIRAEPLTIELNGGQE